MNKQGGFKSPLPFYKGKNNMANNVCYNQLFTDRPESHLADGYVSIGAAGAPTFVNQLSPTISAVTRLSTGVYTISLSENWPGLLYAAVHSVIPATLSPAYLGVQLNSHTVGVAASGQSIQFTFNVGGTPTDLPNGSGFVFLLILKNLSSGV
jgi:hypothetical protein